MRLDFLIEQGTSVAHQFPCLVLREALLLPIIQLRIQATMSKSNAITGNPTKFYGLKACHTPWSQHGTVIAKTLLVLTQYANKILNAFNCDGNVDWVV
ncbi:hypothetical protein AX14_009722, partial [Amanita brunnescens Koide BX004]